MLPRRLAALGILVALCAALCPPIALAEEAASVAVVIKIVGTVEGLQDEDGAWTAMTAGIVLDSGDKLRTAADGGVAVMFLDDRSLLKLAGNTEVTFFAERDDGTVSKRIWMGAGRLWAKVTSGDEPHFQVETPTSVAAVKGSEFYDIENAGGNTLHALTGRYVYGNEHGDIEVLGGQTGASDGGSPPTARPTRPGELPGFGGGLRAYGGQDQVIRVELIDDDGNERVLVIPLVQPQD